MEQFRQVTRVDIDLYELDSFEAFLPLTYLRHLCVRVYSTELLATEAFAKLRLDWILCIS